MPGAVSRVAPSEGVSAELAYGEWPGAEPAVVLVPGIFSTHRSIAALAERIAPTRRVIAFDLRGRGRSTTAGPFGIARHADDLWAALDSLGVERPQLVGHSLGAFVVATAAARKAVERVVLLDGGLWAPYPVPVELVHQVFAEDRARLGREFVDVAAYRADLGDDGELSRTELEYELRPAADRVRPVMAVSVFDEDVASIAEHVGGNGPLGAAGCHVLVLRALRGIGDDPRAQMLPDETIADARGSIRALRVVDVAEATHGALVRERFAALVADEILAETA
ncbi:MAG: alpha/beta fold hydrolase [Gaiellales bacterium]